jgi:hypothetical protein
VSVTVSGPVGKGKPVRGDALLAEECHDLVGRVLGGDSVRDAPEDQVAQVVSVIFLRSGGGSWIMRFRARSCPAVVSARSWIC